MLDINVQINPLPGEQAKMQAAGIASSQFKFPAGVPLPITGDFMAFGGTDNLVLLKVIARAFHFQQTEVLLTLTLADRDEPSSEAGM
ncbi:MAG: hypothetical protein ACRD8U_11495 [Pyrinomonadaceae bacterium]